MLGGHGGVVTPGHRGRVVGVNCCLVPQRTRLLGRYRVSEEGAQTRFQEREKERQRKREREGFQHPNRSTVLPNLFVALVTPFLTPEMFATTT